MQIRRTSVYDSWFKKLKDFVAKRKIAARIARLEDGDSGDSRSVGDGIFELRVHFGPGYRVYYTRRADIFILLLCGGDKGSQSHDIEHAKRLAQELEEE